MTKRSLEKNVLLQNGHKSEYKKGSISIVGWDNKRRASWKARCICTCRTQLPDYVVKNIFNEEEAICFLDIHRHNDMENEQGFFRLTLIGLIIYYIAILMFLIILFI